MASLRSASGPSTRPTDTGRQRRVGAHREIFEESQTYLNRGLRRDVDDRRVPLQASSQSMLPTRPPAGSSSRKASSAAQFAKPGPSHQVHSWGSTSSSSVKSGSNLASISGSSSSNRSQDTSRSSGNQQGGKPSNLTKDTGSAKHGSRSDSTRTSSTSSIPRSRASLDPSIGLHLDRHLTESPTEIRFAHTMEPLNASAQSVTIYPELDRYREIKRPSVSSEGSSIDFPYRLATHDLPPPTPVLLSGTSSQLSAFSGSPSTRFSESPGPGPYSRDTTPTSMTSQSPGLVAPARIAPQRSRQGSPAYTRPPVTRRRAGSIPNEVDAISADPHGLAAVRESLTSSSSNSTVRDGERKENKLRKRLSPPPPSPPPRKSSSKYAKPRENTASPSRPSRRPSGPAMTSQIPGNASPATHSRPIAAAKATPPLRPSRVGTPDIQSQLFGPVPVIHSNLSSTSLSAERRGSEPLVGGSLPRSLTPSSLSDKFEQSSTLPASRKPTPVPATSSTSDSKKQKPDPGRPARTASPNVSTFNTRFPFFGRRKTAPEAAQVEKKEKLTRKGPAAGTGHEGYGRLGAIRRRSSIAVNAVRGLAGSASSQESLASNDPFLLERMNPVIIAGGEIIENRNTSSELSRAESNQGFHSRKASTDSKVSSEMSTTSQDGVSRNTLWPSAFPRSQQTGLASRRPSAGSESDTLPMHSLAFRRSVRNLSASPDHSSRTLPRPINTSGITSPSVTSLGTSIVSDDSRVEPHRDAPKQSTVTPPKKLTKRSKSPRRWNFFRSQSQPTTSKKKAEAVPVPATVKSVQSKPVAFYMMDSSEQEDAEAPDVRDVLRAANVYDTHSPRPTAVNTNLRQPTIPNSTHRPGELVLRPQRLQSPASRLEAPVVAQAPALRPLQPERKQSPVVNSSGRPSRLQQVGRIPKVVSARPEQTSPKSFSRPFHRVSLQMPPDADKLLDPDSVAKGPSPPKPSTPDLIQEGSTLTGGTSASPDCQSTDRGVSPGNYPKGLHIQFSPRKNSQVTIDTESCCTDIESLANVACTGPDVTSVLVEDEIWDEYNDLLGDDVARQPPSATSSKGAPFHLEGGERMYSKKRTDGCLESPTIRQSAKAIRESKEVAATASSVYGDDMTERIKAAFAQKPEPSTPFSVSEFVAGYGDRKSSVDGGKSIGPSQRSSSSSRKSRKSDSSKTSEEETPLSQVNLRVGSMTVSKWLTFGHVLFSPVREELLPVDGSLNRHSILVIDGLGNDDWSFYAAETYPAANFFNLSPRAPLPADHQASSAFPLSPPNHHQIQFVSHMNKFPFGPESFTLVVFRFPAAAPESHYRNIVAEARRVLKPGGYLELSILDLDLNNMGNRGRRTIRRLKERIRERSGDTSLGSTADLMLRLLGKKGFSDLKTCRVGVPVASVIARSNSTGSKGPKKRSRADERSLADMMNDEGEIADESITKMVSKVGRWWYTRCYESAAGIKTGSKSIWVDRPLLAECEEWGTSLKLMVCHARVPDGKSRVASI